MELAKSPGSVTFLATHNTDAAASSSSSSDRDGPYINPLLSPNVVAVLGKEARLKCYVTSLGNKTVSFAGLFRNTKVAQERSKWNKTQPPSQ